VAARNKNTVSKKQHIKRNLRTERMNHVVITSAVTVCESYFGIKQNYVTAG